MPKVLVTDAGERSALAIIRSLGKKGIDVTAADSTLLNTGFMSRYCKKRVIYPSPQKSRSRFLRTLLDIVRKEEFDLLIPVSDFTSMPISENKEDLEKYVKVAAPNYESALAAFDKARTVKAAAEAGIPHPRTAIVEDMNDVREIAKDVNYPAVIKPRMKVMWSGDRAFMFKVTERNYAYNEQELIVRYSEMAHMISRLGTSESLPLIQEYVTGEGWGVEALIHDSELNALFVHRRIHEYPICGGASTLRESAANEQLAALGVRLLKAIGWEGVAMVEFKLDKATNQPFLMEVNGRFWGSLPLSISAGVDFPLLLYNLMVNDETSRPARFRENVKQRWLIPGDILWLMSSIRKDGCFLSSLSEFLKSFNVPDDIISLNDPAPSFGAIADAIAAGFQIATGRRTIEGEILPS